MMHLIVSRVCDWRVNV